MVETSLADNNVTGRWVSSAVRAIRAPLQHPVPEVRWMAWLGWALALSGLVHVGVWFADGLPALAGPTGWRKPIVFGLSGGIATLSLAALSAPVGASSRRWLRAYLVTMALEVGLIDLQAWRGVASHFNSATTLDLVIYNLMAVFILTSMVASIVVGVRAAKALRETDSALATALATVALGVGAVVGLAISIHASIVVPMGGVPSQVGAAGQWKPVHAIALHGLQLFPVLVWALRERGVDMAERVRSLWFSFAAWALVLVAALVQLLLGRAVTDWSVPALVSMALAFLFAGASLSAFVRPTLMPVRVTS